MSKSQQNSAAGLKKAAQVAATAAPEQNADGTLVGAIQASSKAGGASGISHLSAVPSPGPALQPEAPAVGPIRKVSRGIRPAQPAWQTLVMVCKKCSGRPKNLQTELRKVFKKSAMRSIRVVRTGCLDVCPQGGTCCAASNGRELKSFVVMHDTAASEVAGFLTELQSK